MDFNPALPRRSLDTLAAGGCCHRFTGVRRPRRVHRDRTAVPRIDRIDRMTTDTIAPFPQSGVIDAGTYLVTGYPVPFKITIPDGWETFNGEEPGQGRPGSPG